MPSGPLACGWRDAEALFSAGAVAGLDDDELLRRFAARRDVVAEVAFAALVARYGPMVLAACRRALIDEHEAEDAFQATFLVLARRAESVRGATLGAWLYGVARRVARRARADALRCRAGRALDTVALRVVASPHGDAAAVAERAELASVVDEELARLSGRDRAPLLLCDLGGLTHEQAAERLGWPVGTVKSRQARARARLRERMARRGLAPIVAAGLWQSAASARAAPPSRLVRATAEAVQWFAVRGLAPPAGAVPAGVVAAANAVLRGMIMTKLKLTGAVALLGLSAVVGVAVVHGQEGPGPSVTTGRADVAPPPGSIPPAASADRMRALEEKLDRLLRVLEPSTATPLYAPGTTAREPLAPARVLGEKLSRRAENLDNRPQGVTLDRRPAGGTMAAEPSTSERLNDVERRLSRVEQILERLTVRGQPPLQPEDLSPTPNTGRPSKR